MFHVNWYNSNMEKSNKENNSVEIVTVSPELWEVYRDIRLDALQCEPQAFGSSYSKEKSFTKEKWMERIANRYNSIAIENGKAIGTMGAYISNEAEGKVANIVGVYVLSTSRGRGLGTKLFDFVLAKLKEDHKLAKIGSLAGGESSSKLCEVFFISSGVRCYSCCACEFKSLRYFLSTESSSANNRSDLR